MRLRQSGRGRRRHHGCSPSLRDAAIVIGSRHGRAHSIFLVGLREKGAARRRVRRRRRPCRVEGGVCEVLLEAAYQRAVMSTLSGMRSTRCRARSTTTDRSTPYHRYARHYAAGLHDHQGHARRGSGFPGAIHHRSLRCRPLHAADAAARERRAGRPHRYAGSMPAGRVGALDALGGLGSPAGSCVWHVVGLQLRSASGRCARAGGRPVRVQQAQGILIAALGTLAGHYGYEKKRP